MCEKVIIAHYMAQLRIALTSCNNKILNFNLINQNYDSIKIEKCVWVGKGQGD